MKERPSLQQLFVVAFMHGVGYDEAVAVVNSDYDHLDAGEVPEKGQGVFEYYSREEALAVLAEMKARAPQPREEAEERVQAPTAPLGERMGWIVMQLDEAWKAHEREQGRSGDDGPALVFLRAFNPSITFTSANLTLSVEVVDALEQMKTDLDGSGYFREGVCPDPYLLEDADTMLMKLRQRLSALPA